MAEIVGRHLLTLHKKPKNKSFAQLFAQEGVNADFFTCAEMKVMFLRNIS